jgi:guanylate cyclase
MRGRFPVLASTFNRFYSAIISIGVNPDDSQETRLEKNLLVVSALMMSTAGILWGLLYLYFDEIVAALIPISYGFLSYLSAIIFSVNRRFQFFRFSQILLSLLLPFFLSLALGGLINSSAVVLWSFTCPIGALLFAGRRQSFSWFAAYLILVAVSGLLQAFTRPFNNLPAAVVIIFFVLNIIGVSLVAFVLMQHFVNQKNIALDLLRLEQEKSDRLLINVLPREIANRLKNEGRTIAEQFDAVTILFADMVGFTSLSARMAPQDMVDLLNEVFSSFDGLVKQYGLEKIRTIGDNYMVASGVPRPRSNHAQLIARLALDMRAYIEKAQAVGKPLQFRIGINSGPVIGGVIGQEKFHYDIWGDAVNIASRMESHGVAGKIQIARPTYELINRDFICEPHGAIQVKGKGEMETWFLMEER